MHERRYSHAVERLREPDRLARLQAEVVAGLTLEKLDNTASVLDVGTGSGVFAEQFSALGLRVDGIDINPDMLEAARAFVPSGRFHQGIAEKLPFDDEAYDIVFMGLVFHEADEPLAALEEAYRVCRKRCAVVEWPYEEQTFGPPLDHRVPSDRLATLARQAGFRTIETIPLQYLVLYRIEKI